MLRTAIPLSVMRSPLVANVAAYAASEVCAKASRLLTVVAMARFMSPAEIGIAAAALATGEIVKSLTENGIGQMVIAAPQEELERTATTARRLAWLWCTGLALFQAALAGALLAWGADPMLAVLIALLGLEYLLTPGGLVQCMLAMREGKLRQTAAISGSVNVASNLLTAVLVAFVPSALSVVLGKLIPAPLWLLGMRRLRPWRPDGSAGVPVMRFVRYGRAVIGVEFVTALRLQADKLIVGGILGADALGVYFFAINAGLGLANSFSSALATVFFPHLCASASRDRTFLGATVLFVALIAPVVIAQALLAPVYVPLIFGAAWGDVAHLVATLCLAAIPAVVWSTTSRYLRATGRVDTEFLLASAATVTMVATTALAAPFGLEAVAAAFLAATVLTQVGAALPFLIAAVARRPSPAFA